MSSIVESQMDLSKIIEEAVRGGASDVHVSPNKPIVFRVDGQIKDFEGAGIVQRADTENWVSEFLKEKGQKTFRDRKSYDTSVEINTTHDSLKTRARIQFHETLDGICVSCRLVPLEPKPLDELGVPQIIKRWIDKKHGITIISGPTGSGKTTTLAGIVNHINNSLREKIVTLEDPIEFIYKDNKSRIYQREAGTHCEDYTAGLKDISRQDSNIVVVGEVRDRNAMEAVFGMAENGLRVFTSTHGVSAVDTIEKIVGLFDPSDYDRVYKRLYWTLTGVMHNTLLPKRGGGRVLACDIVTCNDKVKGLLKEGKIVQIGQAQESSRDDELVTLKRSMDKLADHRLI